MEVRLEVKSPTASMPFSKHGVNGVAKSLANAVFCMRECLRGVDGFDQERIGIFGSGYAYT